tara:strand:- start:377 stop:1270 length:894 start_codon:yes stop_codon:yes gene_type:complete
MKIGGKIGISHTKDINNAQIAPPIGKLVNDSQGYGMYGLRKVNDGYTGNCIEVRRDSDDATRNIAFDAHGNLDLTGADDGSVSGLETFCSGTDCFVKTWYDQSGNSQNLVQAGSAKQPEIVSSGSVHKANGRPTMKFDGGNDLVKKNMPNDDPSHAIFFVYRLDNSVAASKGILSFHEDDADPAFIKTNSSREIEVNFGEAVSISGGNVENTLFQLAIKVKTGTNSKIVLNGRTSTGLVDLGSNLIKSTVVAREEGDTQSNNSEMSCSELIVITERDVDDDEFQAIQNNINGYYNLG